MKKQFIIIFTIFITTIGISTIKLYQLIKPTLVNGVLFEIKDGDTAPIISQNLYKHGIIRSPKIFLYWIKFQKKDRYLKKGHYYFNGLIKFTEVSDKIIQGKVKLHKLTIPEGLTIEKTCRLLEKNGFGQYKKFKSLCYDTLFVQKLTGYKVKSLEGFLYPETYFLPENVSEEFLLKHIVRYFFKEISQIDFSQSKMEFYDILKLASIVEREVRIPSERKRVASVYLNRLEANQKLQADPTIAYILEKKGKRRKKIYYKDLRIDSPYNTYKYKGLPPTPICNPSFESINAVLNPELTDYFFFFADGTGGHIFSKTYDQHLNRQSLLKKHK